jgi:nucleotide-binding universal stress UspA family protein
MNILIYTDGKAAAAAALRMGSTLHDRLGGEIAFITTRPGSHATEEPPPIGVEFPLTRKKELHPGLQILARDMEQLIEMGFLAVQGNINVRAVRNGYLFLGQTSSGHRVPFYERYDHLLDGLNHEIDDHRHDLLIIAPPQRTGFGRFLLGDASRHLALDLHTSVLMARGGSLEGRFLVCADGSPSARRLFPLLKQMLPAVRGRVDLIWVKEPAATDDEVRSGTECAERARAWLDRCGKTGVLLMPEGERPQDTILEEAGDDSVVVMGASLRHDVHHRVRGSVPLQVLTKTESSVLLAKLPPEVDTDFFEDLATC